MKAQFIVTIDGEWLHGDKPITAAIMERELRHAAKECFAHLAASVTVRPAPSSDTETRDVPVERLHERFLYAPSTGDLYEKSSNQKAGRPSGGYLKVSVDNIDIAVHRIAWAMHYGEWPPAHVDHRDRDRMNNRIDNLRLATVSQNNMNVGSRGKFASKGVGWNVKRGKFRASIRAKNITKNLGYFETEDEAAHAYNKAAIELHGEFAVLNPIGIQPTNFDRLFEVDNDKTEENSDDWVVRGHAHAGDGHPAAKLTKEQVLIIREVYAARTGHKWGAARLAKKFGVSSDAVRLAATGDTWAGLDRTAAQAAPDAGMEPQ